MSRIVYLDNNATTQVAPEVLEAMLPFLHEEYGNPSSLYSLGRRVAKALEEAREKVAALLGAKPSEIIFTSCGTESDNAAIASAIERDPDCRHVVTTSVEHSAIIKQTDALARRGVPVDRVGVDSSGRLDLDRLKSLLDEETAIVSAMWANNETGVVFPVEEIGAIAHEAGVPFHTDAVQVPGKLPINVSNLPIDFLSISGHKLHAPKGVGALYVSSRTRFRPQMLGGGQESGRRGGTENVASIVGLGVAAELALQHLEDEQTRVRSYRDAFESALLHHVPGTRVHGAESPRLPNTTNISFEGIDAEGLLILLDQQGVCASTGSACTTGSLDPSHVLTAMGVPAHLARSSVRFSFGRYNTQADMEAALAAVTKAVEKLRRR